MPEDIAELRSAQEPLSLSDIRLVELDPLPDTGLRQNPRTLRRLRILLHALRITQRIDCGAELDWYLRATERAIFRACGVLQ
jgi:hypothetical protein